MGSGVLVNVGELVAVGVLDGMGVFVEVGAFSVCSAENVFAISVDRALFSSSDSAEKLPHAIANKNTIRNTNIGSGQRWGAQFGKSPSGRRSVSSRRRRR